MLKHLFIEKTLETLDNLIEEIEDREDREDFARTLSHIVDIREEMVMLEEDD